MIKASITKNFKTLILVGLSHRNLDKLREDGMDGFIPVDCGELGLPGVEILITAAPTEDDLKEGLKQFVGPETMVKDER